MTVEPVEDSLCFKFYLASRLMTGLYKPFLETLGLTFPQSLIMGCLWQRNKQTIKALGEKLHLDSGTLTPLIKRLEIQGLTTRKKNNEDKRSSFICLTAKGARLQKKGLEAHQQFYEILEMDDETISALKSIIDKWSEKQIDATDIDF